MYGVNLCSRSNQDSENCFFLEAKKLSCQVMILTWHLKWERPMMNSLKSTSPLPSSSKMSMTRLKSHDIQCQLSFQSFLPFKQGGSGQHFCAWRYCGAMHSSCLESSYRKSVQLALFVIGDTRRSRNYITLKSWAAALQHSAIASHISV